MKWAARETRFRFAPIKKGNSCHYHHHHIIIIITNFFFLFLILLTMFPIIDIPFLIIDMD